MAAGNHSAIDHDIVTATLLSMMDAKCLGLKSTPISEVSDGFCIISLTCLCYFAACRLEEVNSLVVDPLSTQLSGTGT